MSLSVSRRRQGRWPYVRFASAIADRLRSLVGGAREAGMQRVAFAGAIMLALLVGIAFAVVRYRRLRRGRTPVQVP